MIDKFEDKILNKNVKKVNYIDLNMEDLILPLGRLIEVRSQSSANFYFVCHIIKTLQYAPMSVAFLDTDHSQDYLHFNKIGLRTDEIIVASPINYKETFKLIHNLLKINKIKIIVISSILGIFPETQEYQLFRKELEKLNKTIKNTQKSVIFINPYHLKKYNILEEYCSLILYLKKRQSIKKNEEFIGYFVDGQILKNTLNFKINQFNCKVLYNKGLESLDK